jgi:hypothetical protein
MERDKARDECSTENGAACGLRGDVEYAFLYAVTGQTPWWIVSVLLHGLIITLAGLVTMTLDLSDDDEIQVMTDPGCCDRPKWVRFVDQPTPPPVGGVEPPTGAPQEPQGSDKKTWKDGPPTAYPGEGPTLGALHNTSDAPLGNDENATELFRNPTAVELAAANTLPEAGDGLDGSGLEDLIGVGGGFRPGVAGPRGGDPSLKWRAPKFRGRPDGTPRLPRAPGGPQQSRQEWDKLQAALQWLAKHQEYDGHWDAVKYGASSKSDTAVTGFAILAFLGVGHTERVGEHKEVVRRAVAWLKSKQAADGCIWDTTDDGAHHRKIGYPCAIATLAIVEAAGMANVADTKAAAQRAIDYCTQTHQTGSGSDRGGWRYAAGEPGDLSVTGWFIMALKSAKVAGLKVPATAFDGALRFLESVEVKDLPSVAGYGPASRFKYQPNDEHASTAHRLTAIGVLARQFMGWKKEELYASAEWFVAKGGVPTWGANGEKVDLYYWYYATLCVYSHGSSDLWKQWHVGIEKALVEHQSRTGDTAGSWDPVGDYSSEWGRVGQTALSALCLEVYYRLCTMRNLS